MIGGGEAGFILVLIIIGIVASSIFKGRWDD